MWYRRDFVQTVEAAKEARLRFAALAAGPDDGLDLAEAALLIAAEEYPGLDVAAYTRRLDHLAEEARSRLSGVPSDQPEEVVRRFHAFLYREAGFRGNEADYYDPRNSFLNEVLDRRTGIPISLATVYVEVARRLEVAVRGVGFPGHFLAKWELGDREIVVDPFYGSIVSEEDCRRLLQRLSNGQVAFRRELLAPLPVRLMLVRMLANLKGVWVKRGDWERAISAIDRILLLVPRAPQEVRDRGLLWLKLECYRPALKDLESYLAAAPEAPDAPAIAEQLTTLRDLVGKIS